MKIKQQISNHPLFSMMKREVEITNITFNFVDKLILIYFNLLHSDEEGSPIEYKDINQPEYWVVDNSYDLVIRDSEMNPVPNPDFGKTEIHTVPIYDENGEVIGEEEEKEVIVDREEFLKGPAFDVFIRMVAGYEKIVQNYILHDDENGRFNYFEQEETNDVIEDEEVL